VQGNDGVAGGQLERAYWSRGWIPLFVDSGGNMICVDHRPGPNGARGQIVKMEAQDGEGPFLAEGSLAAFLQAQLDLIEQGKATVREDGAIEIDRWS
jgi:cell wall assembly regulator SMI1